MDGKVSGHSLFVGFGWFSGDEGGFRGEWYFPPSPSGKVSVIIRIFSFLLLQEFNISWWVKSRFYCVRRILELLASVGYATKNFFFILLID